MRQFCLRGARLLFLIFAVGGCGNTCVFTAHSQSSDPSASSPQANNLRLPDPLTTIAGAKVTSINQWQASRRPEILELFRQNVYGRAPIVRPDSLRFRIFDSAKDAMAGQATRKQVSISFQGPGGEAAINLVLFIPNAATGPVPCFLLICNRGTENIDPTRTKKSPFWPAEEIVARGYAAAAFFNGDVAPDKHDGFNSGVHRIFPVPGGRRADSWGTIAAWAWGASRVMDYLETDPDIDPRRVALVGHSRGGKTALWAGAEDERFAMVVSNESGSTGAALARGKKGERIRDINRGFPHWFCDNYKRYNDREEELPVDQHMLGALIAPRLLYIASATLDQWSDPGNEFLAAVHAGPVYRLFGHRELPQATMPEPESPLHQGHIGYHLRSGKHNLTEYDWARFMDFADSHLRSSSTPRGDSTLRAESSSPLDSPWPRVSRDCRPWAYWWWMGSAVDETNLTRELQRYRDAGMGGVHIIPIYGARGFETNFIEYLSPRWMAMLDYTVKDANRLGLGVDMTTGSGWCFGGPKVTDQEANASVVARVFEVTGGAKLTEKFDRNVAQALVAFSSDGKSLDLAKHLTPEGLLEWSPPDGSWRVYAISQKPSGQRVKRAAPGGQGHMLNLIYPPAMRHFLSWFDDAFAGYTGKMPRSFYHDSYEYRSDWAPDFFAAFERRRGYRLQEELPALFSPNPADPERTARVKADYRETVSDVMVEETLPMWAKWTRERGVATRNEAHGSPGNWLDLYAVADIPETEMFHKDRNRLVSKFASSAAHVTGKNLVAAETGTWLKEHFTETLADMKYLLDDLFLSGVNHVVYHGTCYSPDEAGWPGWLFYASFQMNPRNPIWRDVPALNAYATRCQSVLQAGRPDNDILLYWPIHDLWHNPAGLVRNLTVHARDWFEGQPIGKAASELWNHGYAFDYISDRQFASARVINGNIKLADAAYSTIVIPRTVHVPVPTMRRLLDLASAGATVLFEGDLPADVPGWGRYLERREELRKLIASLPALSPEANGVAGAKLGQGKIFKGELLPALAAMAVRRESLCDNPELMCVRRLLENGRYYFIANRSEQPHRKWVSLAATNCSVALLDPLSGHTRTAPFEAARDRATRVYLSLEPGESVILRCTDIPAASAREQTLAQVSTQAGNGAVTGSAGILAGVSPALELTGTWQVRFTEGGPAAPSPFETQHLASWTTSGDTNAQCFAGAATYTIRFDAPKETAAAWRLDLGRVCQSARVRLNGKALGTLIAPPFRFEPVELREKENLLEVAVTNVGANRIRDLDRRKVPWKNFYDINFVNIDYKPFDASNWPLTDSGLLGRVTLTALKEVRPER